MVNACQLVRRKHGQSLAQNLRNTSVILLIYIRPDEMLRNIGISSGVQTDNLLLHVTQNAKRIKFVNLFYCIIVILITLITMFLGSLNMFSTLSVEYYHK